MAKERPSDTPLLDQIHNPDDLKKISREQLPQLSEELREEIIRVCSRGGLHLASSLGATDLIVALHYVLHSPTDRILFDVGHQAYAHKILTGRRAQMPTLKQEGGLSGFTKVSESEHDAITVGHASTSLANALGMALARDTQGKAHHIAAVIGDGSLTGGMALAALNTIGDLQPNMLILLNDNEMSISENVGGLNKFMRGLQVQRWVREGENVARRSVEAVSPSLAELARRAKHSTRHFFDPSSANPFAAMGLRYVGPVDGHNVTELVWLLENLIHLDGPTILHVATRKGKGLSYAEADPIGWHGPAKFDPATGEFTPSHSYSWSSAFGDAVTEWAGENPKLYVITPAMREGSGLVRYSQKHPERYLDVGIAEDVAVTAGAGMALAGMQPIVAIYSTFLQRGFDQVLHDVAIENLNVIFAVDRGGIVGADGATHNGVFDLSFLRCIPNMQIAQPKDTAELRAMLRAAEGRGPVAIRYPRGSTDQVAAGRWPEIAWGTWERLKEGDDVVILATGKPLAGALAAAKGRAGVGVVNARFVKPIDAEMLRGIAAKAKAIITVEDNTVRGGFGSGILEFLSEEGLGVPVHVLGIPDQFQEHATPESVYARAGIDAAGIERVLGGLEV